MQQPQVLIGVTHDRWGVTLESPDKNRRRVEVVLPIHSDPRLALSQGRLQGNGFDIAVAAEVLR